MKRDQFPRNFVGGLVLCRSPFLAMEYWHFVARIALQMFCILSAVSAPQRWRAFWGGQHLGSGLCDHEGMEGEVLIRLNC